MADVICLPQNVDSPISQFQLPAKAIDAVAMGVPLLVTRTPPTMDLVRDHVAEVVEPHEIPKAIERACRDSKFAETWRLQTRRVFLARYSYSSAASTLKLLLMGCLDRKRLSLAPTSARVIDLTRHVLGEPRKATFKSVKSGMDIVVFWKQNDTGLYGRRHDMVVEYLASRSDVRKVVVFDAPIPEFDLIRRQRLDNTPSQDRSIYAITYEKLLGLHDTEKIAHSVFIVSPDEYRATRGSLARFQAEAYFPFVDSVLTREGVDPCQSVFWFYPKNFSAPHLVERFSPLRVVVDIVDDHRTWPNTSESEKARLSDNYRQTLSYADMAFANCQSVRSSMVGYFPGIRLVPNGCDPTPPSLVPPDSAEFQAHTSWPGKTIGYVGNLESKIDIALLDSLALRFSNCQLVLIGSTHANPAILRLGAHPNVRMPGVVPYKYLSAWVRHFDVALVPHLNTELTKNMNPLKIFVYLALGIPVVSTDIPNVDSEPLLVHTARDRRHFLETVERLLAKSKPPKKVFEDYVAANTWRVRFETHIDELLSGIH